MATPSTLPASTGNGALDAYTQAGLTALNSGGPDYTQTNAYKTLQGLLGPGPGGGLSATLQGEYNSGAGLIEQNTEANTAAAKSGAEGRGLGGSSIAAQGVESAQQGGQMADASLLGSLDATQNSNTQALAGDLASGSNAQLSDLLSIYDSAGTSAANMQMYSQGLQEALSAANVAGNSAQNAGIFSGVGSAVGGIGMGLALASDERLKQNVEKVGSVGGVGIYKFEYKTGRGFAEGKFVGFMAQEVEKSYPESVVTRRDGFLAVTAPFLPVKVS